MKYKLGLFAMLSFAFGVVHAGHDFMEAFRQEATLVKEEFCSGGKTKIEHRMIRTANGDFPIVFITVNPGNVPEGGAREIFYKLVFYQIDSDHMIKPIGSGNLEKLTRQQWMGELRKADANAAKSLLKESGSDCR